MTRAPRRSGRRALLAALVVLAALPATAQAEPAISVTCNGLANCAPWFTAPVRLDWIVVAGAPIGGCDDRTVAADTKGTEYGCIADDSDPATAPVTRVVTVKLDQTPPVITDAIPERPPDFAGWYTRPVAFTFAAGDATSGVDRCTGATYAGPDDPAAAITGTCRDRAGHVATRAFPLRYDATPPDLSTATVTTGDRRVLLRWPAATAVTVVRTPGFEGDADAALTPATDGLTDVRVRNGIPYRYVVTLADQAGNTASRELLATPGPHLLAPARRATVTAPPRLRWTPVRGARYYNVQLMRGGRKVLSAWPRRAALQLDAAWRYRGEPRRLKPGRYRWFVWPGEGPRAVNEYGPRIGARSFTVAQQ
jgi:hypothetical protein